MVKRAKRAVRKQVVYIGNVPKKGKDMEVLLTPAELKKAHQRYKEDLELWLTSKKTKYTTRNRND